MTFKRRILLLLSHLHDFFSGLIANNKSNTKAVDRLKKIEQKIWFYLSWVNSEPVETFLLLKEETDAAFYEYSILSLADQTKSKLELRDIITKPV